jgi:undecaprenyl-diphosphatase
MDNYDIAITHAINGASQHVAALDWWMVVISTFGVPFLVLAVALQWWSGPDREANRHILLSAGLAFLLGQGLNQLVLLFIHRARPYEVGVTQLLVPPSVDFSFPSDHATAAFAIAATFIFYGAHKRAAAFLLAAGLVGFSRIFIGIHYFGDIVGGAATGVLAAFIVRALYRKNYRAAQFLVKVL